MRGLHINDTYGSMFNVDQLCECKLFDGLRVGDTVVLEFLDLPAPGLVVTNGWSAAENLNDLMFGAGKRYFSQGNSVFVKMKAVGDVWEASDTARIIW